MSHVILNRVNKPSLFKLALHEVLKQKGDPLILGYGYFYYDIITSSEVVKCIKEGFKGINRKKEIIIIGSMKEEVSYYVNAAIKLSAELKEINIKVMIKRIYLEKEKKYKYEKYHKKIAVKYNKYVNIGN